MGTKVDEDAVNSRGNLLMEKIAPVVYGHDTREYWSLNKVIGRSCDIGFD